MYLDKTSSFGALKEAIAILEKDCLTIEPADAKKKQRLIKYQELQKAIELEIEARIE